MKSRHHLLQASGSGGVIEAPGLVQRGGHKVVVRCVRGSAYDFGCVGPSAQLWLYTCHPPGFSIRGAVLSAEVVTSRSCLPSSLMSTIFQGSQVLIGWQSD